MASMTVLRSHSRHQWLYNLTIKYIQRVYSPGTITQPGLGILFPHPLNNGSPSEAAQIDIDSDDILCCATHQPSTTSSFRTISVPYIHQHHAPRYAPKNKRTYLCSTARTRLSPPTETIRFVDESIVASIKSTERPRR